MVGLSEKRCPGSAFELQEQVLPVLHWSAQVESSWTRALFGSSILSSQATQFCWWMFFVFFFASLHKPHLAHLSTIEKFINIKPTWISIHRYMSCVIGDGLNVETMSKWEVVMLLLCWEFMWGCWFQSMIITPMQTLHKHQSWCLFWGNCKYVCVLFFLCNVCVRTPFVLTLIVQLTIGHIMICVIIRSKWIFTFSSYKSVSSDRVSLQLEYQATITTKTKT